MAAVVSTVIQSHLHSTLSLQLLKPPVGIPPPLPSGRLAGWSPGPPRRPSPHFQVSLLTTTSVNLSAEWGLRSTTSVSPYPQARMVHTHLEKGTSTTCSRPHPQVFPGATALTIAKTSSSQTPWPTSAWPCYWAASPLSPAILLTKTPPRRGFKAMASLAPPGTSAPSHTHSPGCAPAPSSPAVALSSGVCAAQGKHD